MNSKQKKYFFVLVGFFIFILILLVYYTNYNKQNTENNYSDFFKKDNLLVSIDQEIQFPSLSDYAKEKNLKSIAIKIKEHDLTLYVADDINLRTRGLGYLKSMEDNEGMLFVFPVSSRLGFWMKGMNFPLDIIWLNENYEIIYLVNNLSPNTYPNSFGPEEYAKYVIELNSGMAAKIGITVGQKINLPANY